MNILFVCTHNPLESSYGAQQRSKWLYSALKRLGNVYTLFLRSGINEETRYLDADKTIFQHRLTPKKVGNFADFFHRVFIKFCDNSPLYYKLFNQPKVSEIFPGVKFDLVVFRYLPNAQKCYLWHLAPVLIDIDDHPFEVFNTTRRQEIPWYFKPIGDVLIRLQTFYSMNKSAGGWIANQFQLKWCSKNYAFLPNIPFLPSAKYDMTETKRNFLFTIGIMSYAPNSNGINFFIDNIWPEFHSKYPDVKYIIGGKGMPPMLIEKCNATEGVEYIGFVDDLEYYYQHCIASVVPIYQGGGTCIKTLESLGYGRSCISTPFGIRGIDKEALDNEHGLLQYTDANSFIRAFELTIDVKRREQAERKAVDFINRNYSTAAFNSAVSSKVEKFVK